MFARIFQRIRSQSARQLLRSHATKGLVFTGVAASTVGTVLCKRNADYDDAYYDEMGRKYKNLPAQFECENCTSTVSAPRHCGHPMHLEPSKPTQGQVQEWVCWMGADCGVKPYVKCCDFPHLSVRS